MTKNNIYKIYFNDLNEKYEELLYIAPEDLRGNISGGHFESLADCLLLSDVFKKITVYYPDHGYSEEKANYLYKKCNKKKNIVLKSLKSKKNLINFFIPFFKRRINLNEFNNNLVNNFKNKLIFIGCHRNLHIQIYLCLKGLKSNIFFKSYGSIFLHNLDNLKAYTLTLKFDQKFFERFFICIFFFFSEWLSFILCKKILITRHILDTINHIPGYIFNKIWNKKTFFSCSGPFYSIINSSSQIKIHNKNETKNSLRKISSFGDNTFPTAKLGFIQLFNKISKLNYKVEIKIAGKYDYAFKSICKKYNNDNLSIILLGYIDNLDDFISNSEHFMIPVSGGSAMPIKAIEIIYKFRNRILITDYIFNSTLNLMKEYIDIDHVYNDVEKFLK